jgi:hypothetical protein
MDINDYLLERGESDWAALLADWNWILPVRFTLWLVNRYGDLFLVLPEDGAVCMLDVGAGTLRRIAHSQEDFDARLRQDNNANEWLMMPLVDDCVAAGLTLTPGHCYGFKQAPALGGAYEVANTEVVDLYTHYSVLGQLHAQVWETLPGSAHPDTAPDAAAEEE